MLPNTNRAHANGAHKNGTFAPRQSNNGQAARRGIRGPSPPHEAKRPSPVSRGPQSQKVIDATAQRTATQLQSRNGNEPIQPRTAFDVINNVREFCLQPWETKSLLLLLATYCDTDGCCWPGNRKLAEKTGLSQSTIVRRLKQLQAAGDIEIVTPGIGRDTKRVIFLARYATFFGAAAAGKLVTALTSLNSSRSHRQDVHNSHSEQPHVHKKLRAKTASDGRGQAAQASSLSVAFPKSLEAMREELAKRGIELRGKEREHADKFFAQNEANGWTTGRGKKREPVHNWISMLLRRLAKIKAGVKTEAATDWREREGKMPLRRMRISGLRRLREKLLDERDALFRADRAGTQEQRAELDKRVEAIDAAEARKTGRSAEVLRLERCARRAEQESAQWKHAPVLPATEVTVAKIHEDSVAMDGWVLDGVHGRFLTPIIADALARSHPEWIDRLRRATRQADGTVTVTSKP